MSPTPRPIEHRFWDKALIGRPDDCWPWTGAPTSLGYGRIMRADQSMTLAHRVSYEMLVGPIPDGLVIDHLCRNRLCINPRHLEAVPHRENTMRGTNVTAANARKSRCIRGHPLSGENLYIAASGKRACRQCQSARDRRRTQARRMGR